MKRQQVVTYQLAYLSKKEVRLCAKHTGFTGLGVLGPVNQGVHESYCDACAFEEASAAREAKP